MYMNTSQLNIVELKISTKIEKQTDLSLYIGEKMNPEGKLVEFTEIKCEDHFGEWILSYYVAQDTFLTITENQIPKIGLFNKLDGSYHPIEVMNPDRILISIGNPEYLGMSTDGFIDIDNDLEKKEISVICNLSEMF